MHSEVNMNVRQNNHQFWIKTDLFFIIHNGSILEIGQGWNVGFRFLYWWITDIGSCTYLINDASFKIFAVSMYRLLHISINTNSITREYSPPTLKRFWGADSLIKPSLRINFKFLTQKYDFGHVSFGVSEW